jgi:protein-S-isoprenylcysteine O-methyltransferase Ste14
MSPKMQSNLLLAVEGLCIIFILVTGSLLVQNLTFLLIQVFGVLLVGWCYLAIKVNNIKPVPGFGNFWATHGPYEIIRHPIYAGILLIMSGFVQWDMTIPRFLSFVVLLGAVLVKMQSDEHLLEEKFKDDYRKYKAKTHRIIPYFY